MRSPPPAISLLLALILLLKADEKMGRGAEIPEFPDPGAVALAAMGRVSKMEDLPGMIEEIRRMNQPGRPSVQPATISAFDSILHAWRNSLAGIFSTRDQWLITNQIQPGPRFSKEFERLRHLAATDLLARSLTMPDLPTNTDGEDVHHCIEHMLDFLVKSHRYPEATRALATYRCIAFGENTPIPDWIDSDLTGLHAFAAGEQLASADCWAEAIRSYRAAAGIPGKFTPSKVAAARVDELTQAHPEEAKTATQRTTLEVIYRNMPQNFAFKAWRPPINPQTKKPGSATPSPSR